MNFISFFFSKKIIHASVCFLWVSCILALSAHSQNNPTIYLEWIDNPLETIVVNWVDESGQDTMVQYRERGSGSNWQSMHADEINLPNTQLVRYRAIIDGLQPGTSYEFRFENIDEVRFFRTAPANIEDEPITFIIGSDITETRGTQEQIQEFREIFEAVTQIAAQKNPLFVVVGGDFVHSPNPYPQFDDWFYLLNYWSNNLRTQEGNYMVPLFGSIGNHEAPNRFGDSPEDAIYYHGFLSYPQEQWDDLRSYGVMDFADYLSVITLDTGHTHTVRSQSNWLRNTIENRSDQTHIFPVYHVPGWPTFRTMRDGTGLIDDIRNRWHPFFRDNGIRFVFEHHDHSYKRTNPFICEPPINNPPDCVIDENFGVIYTGGGTWGSLVRELHPNYTDGGDQWVHAVNELENNFVLVEISESIRKISAVSLTRGIVDEFVDYIKMSPPDEILIEDLTETGFTLHWSEVEGSDEYRIDIAEDENFSQKLPDFDDLRAINRLFVTPSDLQPNRDYFVRIRSRNVYDLSENSETVRVSLIPQAPGISAASGEGVIGFNANWQPVERISGYVVDVSLDEGFQNILEGYNAKDAGTSTSMQVENLTPGTDYFYRVRAVYEGLQSSNSSLASARTTGIDGDNSSVEASLNRVLANGQQTSVITLRLVGEDQNPLAGVPVQLAADNDGAIIQPGSEITDVMGEIEYLVSSTEHGEIQFSARIGNYDLGKTVLIEFIEMLQEPKLGDNFPNPFTDQTYIPVTLPESGRIRIDIINSAGARVQTLLDEELNAGYYEIPYSSRGTASGVYFIRMITETGIQVNKMTKF